jgi:hypothetical protein
MRALKDCPPIWRGAQKGARRKSTAGNLPASASDAFSDLSKGTRSNPPACMKRDFEDTPYRQLYALAGGEDIEIEVLLCRTRRLSSSPTTAARSVTKLCSTAGAPSAAERRLADRGRTLGRRRTRERPTWGQVRRVRRYMVQSAVDSRRTWVRPPQAPKRRYNVMRGSLSDARSGAGRYLLEMDFHESPTGGPSPAGLPTPAPGVECGSARRVAEILCLRSRLTSYSRCNGCSTDGTDRSGPDEPETWNG